MGIQSSSLDQKAAENFLRELGEKITATMSRQSKTPELLRVQRRVGTAWHALILIFISSYLSPWQTDILIRNIGQKAYLNNYSGEWNNVQEILEHYPKSPLQFLRSFLKVHSVEEFFGNIARDAVKELEIIKFIDISKQETGTSRPRRKVRRRGYRDHGTLRLLHQFHGEAPGPSEERQDRRSQISHPLLSEAVEHKSAVAQTGIATTSSKGGEKDVKEGH